MCVWTVLTARLSDCFVGAGANDNPPGPVKICNRTGPGTEFDPPLSDGFDDRGQEMNILGLPEGQICRRASVRRTGRPTLSDEQCTRRVLHPKHHGGCGFRL